MIKLLSASLVLLALTSDAYAFTKLPLPPMPNSDPNAIDKITLGMSNPDLYTPEVMALLVKAREIREAQWQRFSTAVKQGASDSQLGAVGTASSADLELIGQKLNDGGLGAIQVTAEQYVEALNLVSASCGISFKLIREGRTVEMDYDDGTVAGYISLEDLEGQRQSHDVTLVAAPALYSGGQPYLRIQGPVLEDGTSAVAGFLPDGGSDLMKLRVATRLVEPPIQDQFIAFFSGKPARASYEDRREMSFGPRCGGF